MFLFELIPLHAFQTEILVCLDRDNTFLSFHFGSYREIRFSRNFLQTYLPLRIAIIRQHIAVMPETDLIFRGLSFYCLRNLLSRNLKFISVKVIVFLN